MYISLKNARFYVLCTLYSEFKPTRFSASLGKFKDYYICYSSLVFQYSLFNGYNNYKFEQCTMYIVQCTSSAPTIPGNSALHV